MVVVSVLMNPTAESTPGLIPGYDEMILSLWILKCTDWSVQDFQPETFLSHQQVTKSFRWWLMTTLKLLQRYWRHLNLFYLSFILLYLWTYDLYLLNCFWGGKKTFSQRWKVNKKYSMVVIKHHLQNWTCPCSQTNVEGYFKMFNRRKALF